MTAFATADQLAARLGRTFDAAQTVQVEAFLEDATDYLRSVIDGQQITAGASTFTTTVHPGQRHLVFPQYPVRAVTSVTADGHSLTGYQLDGQVLPLDFCSWGHPRRMTVTFEHGYEEVPGELRGWALSLVSQLIAQVEALGSIGSAGRKSTSEQVGGWATSDNWATMGDGASAFYLPQSTIDQLKASYGTSAYVTGEIARHAGTRW